MAKYSYDKYTVNSHIDHSEVYGVINDNLGYNLFPLEASYTYYPSYTYNTFTHKFALTGSPSTRSAGQEPLDGYYVGASSDVANDGVHMIMTNSKSIVGGKIVCMIRHYYDNVTTKYSAGSFIETIIAEEGTYPSNGELGSYWYIKRGALFPALKPRISGSIKTSVGGWVRINGATRTITSMWTRVNGALRKIV